MQEYTNAFLTDWVEPLLHRFKIYSLYTGERCLEYLGDRFRVVLGMPEDWNNRAIGVWLIKKMVLVHAINSVFWCGCAIPILSATH